jgi:hypothetical protein
MGSPIGSRREKWDGELMSEKGFAGAEGRALEGNQFP